MRIALSACVLAAAAGLARGQTDLVANGGFETGAFAPEWTQFGDLSFTGVAATSVHTGTWAGEFGPINAGGIQQTLTAGAGQQVLVDFWYRAQGNQNSFIASLGGQTLASFTNDTSHTAWTELTYLVTIGAANPVLSFTFTNPPDYTYLDDVHVYSDGFGACCLGDATCVAATSAGCAAALGVYRGNGVACGSITCPSGACCLANQSCVVTGTGGCIGRNGVYMGDATACASVQCAARVFATVPLNWNFNGMVHGAAEQGVQNRDNPNGYRSVSDRGLQVDGSAGSINAGPIVDADFMPFSVVTQAGVLDSVHLGDRNFVDNGNWAWGGSANAGLQPAWLPNSDQTGPQVTDVSAMHPVFTSRSSLGVLYQVSNGGGRFDIRLTFTDQSSAVVTVEAPDWYGDRSPPAPGAALAAQRKLGVYTGTGSVDIAAADNPLNVTEAVLNVASLQRAGLGNFAGKELASITFEHPFALNPNYPNPANGAGFAIVAATLGGLGGGAGCYVNCDHSTLAPCLNVNDFGCFLNKFSAGDTYANCDGSTIPPVLNVNDFGCFINKFAAGCSSC